MGKITFRFEKGEKFPQVFEIATGESILDVALDNDISLNHNCGAVCACSTCQVYVEMGGDILAEISDAEEDFIDRARNPRFNSRLACQCKLAAEGDIEVIIPDQSNIIGH